MQLSNFASIVTLFAAALAAPAPEQVKSMMAASQKWTMESFLRDCNKANTLCGYSFKVYTGSGAATPCAYNVSGSTASRASYNSVACGDFTIGSTWSGQFGAGQGFQTLSVVKDGLIIYPAYKDTQLVNNQTVQPDQSYTPQSLP
ncbi:MAG: hypothetical protein MMC23_009268 [Stictis urceolatum]|nr:hypothetical protein [Stictis urceolata]